MHICLPLEKEKRQAPVSPAAQQPVLAQLHLFPPSQSPPPLLVTPQFTLSTSPVLTAWLRLPTPRSAITLASPKALLTSNLPVLAAALDTFNHSHDPKPNSSLPSGHRFGFFSAVFLALVPYTISSSPGVLTTPSSEFSQISVFGPHVSSEHQPHVSNSRHLDFQCGYPIGLLHQYGWPTLVHCTSPYQTRPPSCVA